MKILGIDTSSGRESVALVEGGSIIFDSSAPNQSKASRELLPLIDSALKQSNLTIHNIDAFAVAIGPGSFTGLRIGLATCKGFAQALGKPVIPVSTLEAIVMGCGLKGSVAALMDARRNEVYGALYESTGEKVQLVGKEYATGIERFCDLVDKPTVFVGDGTELNRDAIRERLGSLAHFSTQMPVYSPAGGVAILGAQMTERGCANDFRTLSPRYIRRSEAEIKREEKYRLN